MNHDAVATERDNMKRKGPSEEAAVLIGTADGLEKEVARIMGLTSNEAKIYLALLGENALTVSQLSKTTGIHRTRVYDNLKGLENKGIVTCVDGEPKQFVTVPVAIAISHLIEQMTESLERRKEKLYALQCVLQRLETPKEIRPEQVYIIMVDEILDELRSFLAQAKERVWLCKKTAGGLLDWSVLRDDLRKLQQDGADVRILADSKLDIGFPVRVVRSIPFSYAIVDATVFCFFLDKNVRDLGKALVTSNDEFLSFLASSYQNWWMSAE